MKKEFTTDVNIYVDTNRTLVIAAESLEEALKKAKDEALAGFDPYDIEVEVVEIREEAM